MVVCSTKSRWSQLGQAKTGDPTRKTTEAERAGRMAQVVECLPSKCETLSSNPNMATKKFLAQKESSINAIINYYFIIIRHNIRYCYLVFNNISDM
jgi:hypothetical protein